MMILASQDARGGFGASFALPGTLVVRAARDRLRQGLNRREGASAQAMRVRVGR